MKSSRRRSVKRVNIAWSESASEQLGWPQSTATARALPSLYVGFGLFPALVLDEQWLAAAVNAIKPEGAEQFLVNLLHVLRQTFAGGG